MRGREQQHVRQPRRQIVERVERRGESGTWRRLVLVLASSTISPDETVRRTVTIPPAAVDVAAIERRPFLRAQASRGGEHRQRPVDRGEFRADRVELVDGERAHRPGRWLRVGSSELRRVALNLLPSDGGLERLAEGLHDPVTRRLGAASRTTTRARRSSAPDRAAARRRRRGWSGQAGPGASRSFGPDVDGVTFEVELNEFGERQLGQRRRARRVAAARSRRGSAPSAALLLGNGALALTPAVLVVIAQPPSVRAEPVCLASLCRGHRQFSFRGASPARPGGAGRGGLARAPGRPSGPRLSAQRASRPRSFGLADRHALAPHGT